MKSLRDFRFTEKFMRLHEIEISTIKVRNTNTNIGKTSINDDGPVGTGELKS